MNAHVHPALSFRAIDDVAIDQAACALARIRHLAAALVRLGDAMVDEGDGRSGNMIAALAVCIEETAKGGEASLGWSESPAST